MQKNAKKLVEFSLLCALQLLDGIKATILNIKQRTSNEHAYFQNGLLNNPYMKRQRERNRMRQRVSEEKRRRTVAALVGNTAEPLTCMHQFI